MLNCLFRSFLFAATSNSEENIWMFSITWLVRRWKNCLLFVSLEYNYCIGLPFSCDIKDKMCSEEGTRKGSVRDCTSLELPPAWVGDTNLYEVYVCEKLKDMWTTQSKHWSTRTNSVVWPIPFWFKTGFRKKMIDKVVRLPEVPFAGKSN